MVVMSRENIERYPLGGTFEFRFEPVYNTIFLLMKYGACPWMSAPYSPHLSADFEAVAFEEGEGLAVSIIQICNEDGKIYNMSFLTQFFLRTSSSWKDCSFLFSFSASPPFGRTNPSPYLQLNSSTLRSSSHPSTWSSICTGPTPTGVPV